MQICFCVFFFFFVLLLEAFLFVQNDSGDCLGEATVPLKPHFMKDFGIRI